MWPLYIATNCTALLCQVADCPQIQDFMKLIAAKIGFFRRNRLKQQLILISLQKTGSDLKHATSIKRLRINQQKRCCLKSLQSSIQCVGLLHVKPWCESQTLKKNIKKSFSTISPLNRLLAKNLQKLDKINTQNMSGMRNQVNNPD